VTPELRAERLAREVVRRIQEARKAAGLAVTDRIAVRWATVPAVSGAGASGGGASGDEASGPEASAALASALAQHGAMIASEVLAVEFGPGTGTGRWQEHLDAGLGLRFWLTAAAG